MLWYIHTYSTNYDAASQVLLSTSSMTSSVWLHVWMWMWL